MASAPATVQCMPARLQRVPIATLHPASTTPVEVHNPAATSPSDPDAKITKMKDGRTHVAHKAEHAVDVQTGAIIAVTVQGADQGDTSTIGKTLEEAEQQLHLGAREN